MFRIKTMVFWGLILSALLARCAEEKHGRLEWVGSNTVWVGEYFYTEDRTARHKIKNTGEAPLRISRVVLTCSCMRLDSFPSVLQPNESGEVVVTIRKNEVMGTFQRIFFIESDDPAKPRLQGAIQGKACPLFKVDCDREPVLKDAEPGMVWTGKYTVTAMRGGYTLSHPVVLNHGTRCEHAIRTNAQDLISYDVTFVTTVVDTKNGVESVLLFSVLDSKGVKQEDVAPVRISFRGGYPSTFKAIPEKLLIPRSAKPVTRRVNLSTLSSRLPEDAKLNWHSGLGGVAVTYRPSKSGMAFIAEVTFQTNAVQQLFDKGSENMTFTCGDWSVQVPVLPSK
ncbi:MAG TPA: DUF1573 domain-containing protein [Kiritimatiellia bacterium]|nr:DUF1573 domain-containing protein [Kiritimatiellia bacterium]HPS06404.1 DUF1573 domain-containing protein [Kiritimatiellia bacterium]